MSDIGFVRTEMLPEREPPASTVGALGWARANLFSNWFNSVLTLASLYAVFAILAAVLPWIFSPTWNGTSLSNCREILTAAGSVGDHGTSGACWGVIRERWIQLLFGFYPSELYWRPILAFILLGVALAPVLFSDKMPSKMLIFSGLYPFIFPWLLWGGTIWGPIAALLGFVLGWVIYSAVSKTMSSLIGILLGAAAALVWWLVLAGFFVGVFDSVLAIGIEAVESRKFGGFMLSITIGVVAIACSLPLGIVLALGRQSDLLIVKYICVGFIEFIRGVPLITLLFVASTLLNIFMPPGTNFDIILRVLIMVTLFAAAYMAEVIRGGLAALPKGQYEGADSLGLNYWQAQRLIIMPQALKISIPGIVSTFIGVFKDTVLVSIIGLLDPLGLSNAIRADANWNGIVWEIYGFIALIFFVFCFGMSRYSMYLERKLHTGHR
ncbi:amino acid ABC transporter permease [Ruegeria pomeroyi]|jgi:general L-amino acid transport system permease protein|uniref:Glutamate/glutamine/aspartate/asparagine ABC transporter, permease protein n=2 Tax=Ruegeria pomeroyi TaxID=89184 RepID=Q5LW22_RUEPO|nr:amino acid ABC transporter permease [Ruegeria pomeroyi]HCE69747.1 amino acid ABC transporter permease [Ruegeria sp.]AAV93838.1 glutamate/glutamine/aspartate/asparagine ABC transporter, permease protein [Ruegeria pomeroyi DSS-3]NVK95390.1 amino acid ABC transporter permease [Ruegeria pomeroyi]NVL02081.1 amino acid ABC transporter permease [Ruegeria pomeroyi]QWV07430.1 amino acid ABC transporter permease [Ruegeria pomeroyi]